MVGSVPEIAIFYREVSNMNVNIQVRPFFFIQMHFGYKNCLFLCVMNLLDFLIDPVQELVKKTQFLS